MAAPRSKTASQIATLESRATLAEKQSNAWREQAGRERARNTELEARLRTRDETIVQLGIRLGRYGDPEPENVGYTPS